MAVLIALGVASGCSNDDPAIKPGTCLAKQADDGARRAPDLTSVVPCTSPHRFEVYNVVGLPDGEDLGERAQRRCAISLLRYTGYDALKVNGKNAEAVGLGPAMRGVDAPLYAVAPRTPWQDDRRQVVCMARMNVPVQAASGDDLLLSIAKTSDFPVALRACRAYDADRRAVADAPCTRRHVSELLFTFEADKALGRKFVEAIVRDPAAERFDRLDDVCTKALPQLLGKGYDKQLRGFGSVARRWTDESKPVRCDVGPVEFRVNDLPAGSLVGTNGVNVKLVPIPPEEPGEA